MILNKLKVIRGTAEIYENDENLSIRAVAILPHIYHISIKNYLDNEQNLRLISLIPIKNFINRKIRIGVTIFRAYNATCWGFV
jgi:hypothetical protein